MYYIELCMYWAAEVCAISYDRSVAGISPAKEGTP